MKKLRPTMKIMAMAGIIGLILAVSFSYASVSEDFESSQTGSPPVGWNFMENWGDSGTIKVYDSVGANASKSVRVVGKPGWAQGIYLPGSVAANDVQISFDVYVESGGVPEHPSAYFIYNGVTLDIRPDGDTFVIMVDHSLTNQMGPLETAKWQRINMSVDRTNGTISLSADQHELKNVAVTPDESGGWASDISLCGDNNGNVASYFDNISLDVVTSAGKLEIIAANAKWEDNHDPMNAVDGDISVGYYSAGTHDFGRDPDMWWEADLGSVRSVNKIRVYWKAVEYRKEIKITGSQDGITYSPLVDTTRVNIDGFWTEFDVTGSYRFLRLLYVGSGSGGEGLDLMEFEVYAVQELDSGLIAYYPFNGNARDESGNGNHGLENGGLSYVAGQFEQAASFDGTDDYISFPNNLPSYPEVTISLWVNFNSLELSQLYTALCGPDLRGGIGFFVVDDVLFFDVGNDCERYPSEYNRLTYSISNNITTGLWYHIAGVFSSGSSMVLYVNGNPVGHTSSDVPASYISNPQYIGTNPRDVGGTYNLDGKIDQLRIYSRALSESEIQELYTEGASSSHTLSTSVSLSSGGTISRSPDKSDYDHNATVTLTAVPADCYEFAGWSGDCSGTSQECSLTMDADKSVTANFAIKTFSLSITAENGSVAQSPSASSYDCGTEVSLTAVPDADYHFVRWEGDASGTDSEISIDMNADRNIAAIFEQDAPEIFTLTKNASPSFGGIVAASLTEPEKTEYTEDESVTLYATPSPCHEFTEWSGACTGTSPICTLTMDADKSVTGNFAIKKFSVSITAENGSVTRTPSASAYDCDSTVSLTAVPDLGYKFDHWDGDITGSHAETSLTISDDMAITAVFVPKSEPGDQNEYIIGGLTITADTISDNGNGESIAQSNVCINNFLYFDGTLTISQNAFTISGIGELYMKNVPGLGRLSLYNGEFAFDANDLLSESLDSEDTTLTIGGIQAELKQVRLISEGLEIDGYLNVGSTKLGCDFEITCTAGINLIGGTIKIGDSELSIYDVEIGVNELTIGKGTFSVDKVGTVSINNLVLDKDEIAAENSVLSFMDVELELENLEVNVSEFVVSGSFSAHDVEVSVSELMISKTSFTMKGASFQLGGLDAKISYSEPQDTGDMVLQGSLKLPANMSGVYVDTDFILHENGIIDIRGKIENIDVPMGSSGYRLKDGWLAFNTQTREYEGGATLAIPKLFDVEAEVGVLEGSLNNVYVALDDLNKPVLNPPVAYIQRIGAGAEQLKYGPVIIKGDMAFTAGPQVEIGGKYYYVIRGEIRITIDTGGRLEGTGDIFMFTEDGRLASGTVIITPTGVKISGQTDILGIFTARAEMRVDKSSHLNGSFKGGSLCAPDHWIWIGGKCFYSVEASINDTCIYTSVKAFIGKVDITYDGNEWDIWKSGKPASDKWSVGDNLKVIGSYRETQADSLRDATEYLTLSGTVPYAFFRIEWTNETDIDVSLESPDGKIYTPSYSGSEAFYSKNLTINEIYYAVKEPEMGQWKMVVPDSPDIGEYTVQLYIPNATPSIELVAPAGQVSESPVTIVWNAEDTDDEAVVSLYYDTDNQGLDGTLIASDLQEGMNVTYDWDAEDVPTGTYFIYAAIYDGHNAPVYAYSSGVVTRLHSDAPPAPENVNILPVEGGISCSWDAHTGEDFIGYRIYYSPVNGADSEAEVVDVGYRNTYEVSGLTGWKYSVYMTAYDEDGVESKATLPVTVTLDSAEDNNIPQIISKPIELAKVNELYRYDVNATDLDGDILTYSILPPPIGGMSINNDTGVIEWTPAKAGSVMITVQVTDSKDGKDFQSYYLNIFEEWSNTGPVIITTPPSDVIKPNAEFVYPIEAMDNDGDTFRFNLLTGHDRMTLEENILIWNPNDNDGGIHPVVIEVRDSENMTNTQFFQVAVEEGRNFSLKDAISALKVLAGNESSISTNTDADLNGKIEIKDAVYVLRVLAGLRD
jgi:hypothetical protein